MKTPTEYQTNLNAGKITAEMIFDCWKSLKTRIHNCSYMANVPTLSKNEKCNYLKKLREHRNAAKRFTSLLATTTVTQLYNIKDNVLIEDDIKEVVSAQFVTKVINQLKVNQMKRIAAKLQAA